MPSNQCIYSEMRSLISRFREGRVPLLSFINRLHDLNGGFIDKTDSDWDTFFDKWYLELEMIYALSASDKNGQLDAKDIEDIKSIVSILDNRIKQYIQPEGT